MLALTLLGCVTPPHGPARDGDDSAAVVLMTDRVRVGNLVLDGVPDIPARISARLRQYRNTRGARFRGWLDQGILISTRFGDTDQLHRVRQPLGAREQLTFFEEPVSRAYVPEVANAAGLVFARDTGGSEYYQLFWRDWETGESRLLTDGRSRYGSVSWSNAADRFAYTTTERNGRSWDIHVQNLSGNRGVLLETERGSWAAMDWAADDQRLLVGQYLSVAESHVFELDLASGTVRPLLDETIHAAIGDARYSTDGGVYFTSDMGAEFMRLHHLDLASGRVEVLTGDVPWDVSTFEVSMDGRYLAMVFNEGGVGRLRVQQTDRGTPLALPELPLGVIDNLAFSPDSRQLGFALNQATEPRDVYSIDLDERSLTRWTKSEVGGLDTEKFIVPKIVDYPTFDEVNGRPRRIPALLYQPPGPGPHPVVVNIHGGPESQYRPVFSSTSQYLASELGIAVIAPNVRGSTGYGKSYVGLDNGRQREGSVRDIGALLDWIESEPALDQDRVAVMGGSYGGYMVLAAMVHYSDRLVAGIERVGISNFVTFLTNTQDYRRDLRRVEYGDERDPDMRAFLHGISPLNQVERITRPMMISQGYNDPRVPVGESEQIVAALKTARVPVWYVLAMDEGHGFNKKVNADYNLAATMLFIERYLLGSNGR